MNPTRRTALAFGAAAVTLGGGAWGQSMGAPAIVRSGPRPTLFVDRFGLSTGRATTAASFAEVQAALANPAQARSESVQNLSFFFANGGAQAVLLDLDDVSANAVATRLLARDAPHSVDFISIPPGARVSEPLISDAAAIYRAGAAFAEARRAVLLIDPPTFLTSGATAQDYVTRWRTPLAIDSAFAAFFAPHVVVMAPGSAMVPFCVSGVVAGLATPTDNQTGAWRAPTGAIRAAAPQTGINTASATAFLAAGINPIRALPGGAQLQGARTASSDPQWRYIPVRRLASLIERDVQTLSSWVVTQPNTSTTWASIKGAIEAYLLTLFRDGALMGVQQSQAFFVRADATTMTQTDIGEGRINVLIGFAPLRPSEFLLLRVPFTAKV